MWSSVRSTRDFTFLLVSDTINTSVSVTSKRKFYIDPFFVVSMHAKLTSFGLFMEESG